MATNVPLTIQTIQNVNNSSQIVIGSNSLICEQKQNVYWFVVVDRSDLSVKANFTTSTNNAVPSQLTPYLNNTQYVMIVTTQGLTTANLPTGPLYEFFIKEGAGSVLNRAEQIYETLGCGSWGWLNYAYATILGDANSDGFEFMGLYEPTMVTTLTFMPTTVNGATIYTPTTL
jgi:hypothetical protein